jgi:ABC-type Fe3+/spermidine/putrescine transport system ATPase subunit
MSGAKEYSVPLLEVSNLTKTFGASRAVNGISFAIEPGEILVIVGGSGCGKTTTLRCIAGLEPVTSGEIRLDGKTIASPSVSVPPEQRGIGMVFQSYALWPHKTVAENVAYGLARRRIGAAEAEAKVSRILEQVGLAGFERRMPGTLSGGQQQRVALARSAVLQPRLLLLDEPLSNLDAKLREQMRDELRDMIKMFNMTAVHITHDQAEAMALADRVICMRGGVIEQEGTPQQIYREPASRYVAEFIGASSFLEGRMRAASPDAMVDLANGMVVHVTGRTLPPAGQACVLAVRPEAVLMAPASGAMPGVANHFRAVVKRRVFLGPHSEYVLAFGACELKSYSAIDFEPGDEVDIHIEPSRATCMAVGDAHERRLGS